MGLQQPTPLVEGGIVSIVVDCRAGMLLHFPFRYRPHVFRFKWEHWECATCAVCHRPDVIFRILIGKDIVGPQNSRKNSRGEGIQGSTCSRSFL